jgi:hypothetical protein
MHKKGQVALEFLTTYGWAFLIILILVTAFAYFGALNPGSQIPSNCQGIVGMSCTEVQFYLDGARLVLQNTGDSFYVINNTARIISESSKASCLDGEVFFHSNFVKTHESLVIDILGCDFDPHSLTSLKIGFDFVYAGKTFQKVAIVDLSGYVQSKNIESLFTLSSQSLVYEHRVINPLTGAEMIVYSTDSVLTSSSKIWADAGMTTPYYGDIVLGDGSLIRILPDGEICVGNCGQQVFAFEIFDGEGYLTIYALNSFAPGVVVFRNSELTQLMNGWGSFMYQGEYYQIDGFGRVCTENWYCGVSYGLEVSIFKIDDGIYNMPVYLYASTQEFAIGMRIYADETFTYTLYENSVFRFAEKYYHLNEDSVITLISADNPNPNIQELVTYSDCIAYKLNINSYVVLKIGNSYYTESFELLENVQIFTPQSCPCFLTYVYQDCSGGNIFPVYAIAGDYQYLVFTDASCSQIATTLSYGTNEFASRGVINGYYSPINSFSISSLGVASVDYSCLDLDTGGESPTDQIGESIDESNSDDDYFEGYAIYQELVVYHPCYETVQLDLYLGQDYSGTTYILDSFSSLFSGEYLDGGFVYTILDGNVINSDEWYAGYCNS